MRAVLQRVQRARVLVDHQVTGAISQGLLVLLGIEEEDDLSDLEWLVGKICKMRIFSDEEGKMNLSVKDVGGDLLLVSQFTLHASTKKGNRPSYTKAATPDKARSLYEKSIDYFEDEMQKSIGTGIFGAHMDVELVNDGPVTIIIDSKLKE